MPLNTDDVTYDARTKPLSQALARHLEAAAPEADRVAARRRSCGKGKVLIDWSQNDEHKTTVCVYSLRARERPTVSTPLAWEELEDGDPATLVFEADDVLERVEEHGDLFAPVVELEQRAARALYAGSVASDGRLVARPAGRAPRRRAPDDRPTLGRRPGRARARRWSRTWPRTRGLELGQPRARRRSWSAAREWARAEPRRRSPTCSTRWPSASTSRLELRRARWRARCGWAPAATLAAEAGLVIGYVVPARARPVRALAAGRRRAAAAAVRRARTSTRPCASSTWTREPLLALDLRSTSSRTCFQFQGVPWLREHLGGLLREYLSTVEVRIERGAAGGLPSLPDPAAARRGLPRGRAGGARPDARAARR